MIALDSWADWLKEGHFYSFDDQQRVRRFFNVLYRDWAHIEYTWEEDVLAGEASGPVTITDLETTKESQIWQIIFGLNVDAYIYTHLPTDMDRHGTAKQPKQTSSLRTVGHYRMQDSWWDRPSFVTEHFLIKPHTPFIAFTAYNPQSIDFTASYHPVKLNIYIAKCEMEIIGEVSNGEQAAATPRFAETLDKLHRRVIPHRPLTLWPLRAPAKGV